MLQEVYDNQLLSAKARYMYLHCLHVGRVLTVDEFNTFLPESKGAISTGMQELKRFGYVKAVVTRTAGGHLNTDLMFGVDSLNANASTVLNAPTTQLPTVGSPAIGEVVYSTNSKETIKSLEGLRPSNLVDGRGPIDTLEREAEESEEVQMPWPIDEVQPESRSQARRFAIQNGDDDIVGAVGRFEETPEQKKARRNAKYKKTSFNAVPKSMQRNDRSEEDWNTHDIVAEFYDLLREKVPGVPDQVNGATLTKVLNGYVRDGATRPGLLAAVRMFFADPRMIANPGIGKDMMHRFFGYYKTVHGLVTKEVIEEGNFLSETTLSKQDELLRVLGEN